MQSAAVAIPPQKTTATTAAAAITVTTATQFENCGSGPWPAICSLCRGSSPHLPWFDMQNHTGIRGALAPNEQRPSGRRHKRESGLRGTPWPGRLSLVCSSLTDDAEYRQVCCPSSRSSNPRRRHLLQLWPIGGQNLVVVYLQRCGTFLAFATLRPASCLLRPASFALPFIAHLQCGISPRGRFL